MRRSTAVQRTAEKAAYCEGAPGAPQDPREHVATSVPKDPIDELGVKGFFCQDFPSLRAFAQSEQAASGLAVLL